MANYIIWFKTYPFRAIKNSILYFDKDPSHISDEVIEMFHYYGHSYHLITPGLTSFSQALDLCINKPFKDFLKIKYKEFCIKWKNIKKT